MTRRSTPVALRVLFASTLLSMVACGSDSGSVTGDGTSDLVDMKNKVLTFSGWLGPKGYLGIQLIADDCPMLKKGAIVRVNGQIVPTDLGDNTGGFFKGPCYWPGAYLSQTDLGLPLAVEISDHSQRILAVVSPGPAGLALASDKTLTAPVGGEVVVGFQGPAGALPPIAVAHLNKIDDQAYRPLAGRAEGGALRFRLPKEKPAGRYELTVSTGLFSACENATCDGVFLDAAPEVTTLGPIEQRFDLVIGP
jgi:hypothetical protein